MNRFKVNQCFSISNRGCVLSGDILEGEISAGQWIVAESNVHLKIKSVEFLDDRAREIAEVALLIDATGKELAEKLIGKTVSIK